MNTTKGSYMKTYAKYIYIITTISASVFLMQMLNTGKDNLYVLVDNIYLKKIDYFSKYNIIQQKNEQTKTLMVNVVKIGELKNQVIIKNRKGNILILDKTTKDIQTLNASTQYESLNLLNPWTYVEMVTLNEPKRLFRQILTMALILLICFSLMKIFKKTGIN